MPYLLLIPISLASTGSSLHFSFICGWKIQTKWDCVAPPVKWPTKVIMHVLKHSKCDNICTLTESHTRCRWPCSLDIGLNPLGCWDHGFKSHWVHGCSSLVFVICCVGSGLCNKLVPHSEKSYQACASVCVRLCVTWKPQEWGSLCPSWTVATQKVKELEHMYRMCVYQVA
jgi:hypothetical protein